MEINELMSGNTLVVCPVGCLDSVTSPELDSYLNAKLDEHASVVVDMQEMDYVSSAGLRIFLLVAKKMKGKGGDFVFCTLQPNIYNVFEVSGFLSILSVYENRQQALSDIQK